MDVQLPLVRFGRHWVWEMAVTVPLVDEVFLDATEPDDFDLCERLKQTVAGMLRLDADKVWMDLLDLKVEPPVPQLRPKDIEDLSTLGSGSVDVDNRVPGSLHVVLWSQWSRAHDLRFQKKQPSWLRAKQSLRDTPRPARSYLLTVSRNALREILTTRLRNRSVSIVAGLNDPSTLSAVSSSANATVQR